MTSTTTTSTTTTKPTLLLVPGAWFPPSIFAKLILSLKNNSYNDIVIASYPSINPKTESTAASADCAADTQYVRDMYLLPLIEAGKDIVVFAHSYGGMPAAGAAAGLTRHARRRAEKKGGVIGLIMVSAFVVREGVSCAGAMGGDTPAWVLKDNPSKNLCWPDNAHTMFAADVPEDTALEGLSILVPHATVAFFSDQPKPVFSEPEFEGLFAYIKLLEDQAVPVLGQEAMMEYSGVEWITRELPFSHNSGFVTKTDEMVRVIDELVGVFEARA